MASSLVSSSLVLKPSAVPAVSRPQAKGLPSLARPSSSYGLKVMAKNRKIKTDTPYGPGGGMSLVNGVDASGRKLKGKGVYQFVDKYGANVDGYSPIYSPDEWSPSGDVYVGGSACEGNGGICNLIGASSRDWELIFLLLCHRKASTIEKAMMLSRLTEKATK